MVEVSLDGAYADEELLEGANLVEQPVIQYRPLHFGHATLKDTDATYSLVQNVSVSIENNVDLIQEIGTRTAVDYSPKIRSTSLSWSDITEDDSELKDMYGGNTSVQETVENTSDVTVLFDNRKSGADKNTLQIDLDGVFQNEYGRSGVGDPEADLQGSMTGMTVGVTVTVGVTEAVTVGVTVAVAVAVGVTVAVTVGVNVGVTVAVTVGVTVALAVTVGVNVGVTVTVDVGVTVGVTPAESVGVGVTAGVPVTLGVMVVVGV
jgi:hypothetical protein